LSRDQTFKFKKLQAFATREYKEKKPKRVIVRRIVSIKIVPKTIIPSINVKSDLDLNPFLLISDFGSTIRMYYMLPDCTMLGAENYPKKEFEKIERKIRRYSKKVLELPQITAEEMFNERRTPYHEKISKMEGLRFNFKELEDKFSRELKSLSKLTGLTGTLKNITLTDKKTEKRRFGVIIDKNKLKININCLNSPLIEGIVYRECLFVLIPRYITCDLIDLCSLGAYILLPSELRDKWREKWSKVSEFEKLDLAQFTKDDIKKIFGFFGYIKPYLDKTKLSEEESETLVEIILKNFKKNNRCISALFFKYLADLNKNQIDLYDLSKTKEIILKYMLKQEKLDYQKIKNLRFVKLGLNLIDMKLFEFYNEYNEIKNIPSGLNRIFQEFLRENKPLKLEMEYPSEISFEEVIDFNLIIHNQSNFTFNILEIIDSFSSAFNIIENKQKEEKIYVIPPYQSIFIPFRLKPIKKGNLKLKAIKISCENNLNQSYKLKSKPIKFKIK